jgi:Resolvase, N terminal domain
MLVVTKLDWLARSLPDARDIVAELTDRGVRLSIGGSVHDPSDPAGRLLFNVLAMVAEFEPDLIRACTRQGGPSLVPRAACAANPPSSTLAGRRTWSRCMPPGRTGRASLLSCSVSAARRFTERWIARAGRHVDLIALVVGNAALLPVPARRRFAKERRGRGRGGQAGAEVGRQERACRAAADASGGRRVGTANI